MFRRRFAFGKDPGAFERDIDAELTPRELGRIALGGDADLAAADIHPVVAARDFAREAAVDAVIPEQVCVGLDRPQIVDPNDLYLGMLVLTGRPQNQPADAAEAVDAYPYRHLRSSRKLSPIYRSARAASATFSGVMPKCGNSASPGADAPNPVMPMNAPRGPSQRSQPNSTAASTATRGAEPSTASWCSLLNFSNSSQQGIDTTAARIPSLASISRAAIATVTSEPVASRVTWRAPPASANT